MHTQVHTPTHTEDLKPAGLSETLDAFPFGIDCVGCGYQWENTISKS